MLKCRQIIRLFPLTKLKSIIQKGKPRQVSFVWKLAQDQVVAEYIMGANGKKPKKENLVKRKLFLLPLNPDLKAGEKVGKKRSKILM